MISGPKKRSTRPSDLTFNAFSRIGDEIVLLITFHRGDVVTLDPVSQSVIHVYDLRALSNPGKLIKCKILVSFPGLVDLNADLAKISNSPGNCFQD
jgi:hypothetical protein